MYDYGYPGLSPYARAFEQLRRARSRQLWTRMALWVWCAATVIWALPVGPWSAIALPVWAALTSGTALAAIGTALGLLHRRVSRTDAIRAAIARLTEESLP